MKPATPYQRGRRQQAIHRNRLDMPTGPEMIRNLMAIYAQSKDEERITGLAWYQTAKVESERATSGHPYAAGIVAAMSPQSSWGRNLEDVYALFEGNLDGTTQSEDNLVKAILLIGGENPKDVLGGRKVRSFWRNIEHPERPGGVTIDRHAVAAAFLGAASPEYLRVHVSGRLLERVGCYQIVAGAYRTCARSLKIYPHQLQAIIWLTWRRINEISWANQDPF